MLTLEICSIFDDNAITFTQQSQPAKWNITWFCTG